MFNKKTVFLATILATTAASNAHAENDWYVGINLDTVDVSDVNTASDAPVGNVTRRLDLVSDDDTGIGIKVGRTLFTTNAGHQFSLELNYANSEHDLENIAFMGNNFLASDGRGEGEIEVETLLLRAQYKFELGAIDPYIGIGIGSVDFSGDGRYGASVGSAPQSQPPFFNADDSASAVQLRLGAEYSLNDNVGLYVEYTNTDVDDVSFARRGGGPGGLATTTQVGDFDFDTFSFGVNYRF